jgi:hypothetical protein
MVGHQNVRMQRALRLDERFVEPVEIGGVVVFGEETGLSIMTPLDDVQGDAIQKRIKGARLEYPISIKQISIKDRLKSPNPGSNKCKQGRESRVGPAQYADSVK